MRAITTDAHGREVLVADGRYTVSDLWLQVKWLFYAPGDWVICFVGKTGLRDFFEISIYSLGNWFSATVGGVVWTFGLFFALLMIAVAVESRPVQR
jgi:hypothetical protein